MRNRIILTVFVLTCLAFSQTAWAQDRAFGRPTTETQPDKDVTPGPGWKTCPRCTNNKQLEAANKAYKVEGHPFDPHDLSGVWGNNGIELDVKNVPPFTPLGQQMFEATRSEIPTTSSKAIIPLIGMRSSESSLAPAPKRPSKRSWRLGKPTPLGDAPAAFGGPNSLTTWLRSSSANKIAWPSLWPANAARSSLKRWLVALPL